MKKLTPEERKALCEETDRRVRTAAVLLGLVALLVCGYPCYSCYMTWWG